MMILLENLCTTLLVHIVRSKKEVIPQDPFQNLLGERVIIGPNGIHFDKVVIPSSQTITPHNDHLSPIGLKL